ncbi:MAG TPA: IgGFc-binding protein [Minicystis sp.]|nr:IgGFc-binding protein [Minicystis sp.]
MNRSGRFGRALAALSLGGGALALSALGACGSSDTGSGGAGAHGSGGAGGSGGGFFCQPGAAAKCDGDTAVSCTPDANGGHPKTDCTKQGETCVEPFGCVVCAPGSGTCKDGQAKACRPDGSGYVEFACDPVQGESCTASGCKGACSPGELGPSYIGCDYWPTVTLNPVWSGFDFAVAVANASNQTAKVTVTKGSSTVQTATVPPGNLSVFKLPWVAELKGGDVDACQNPPEPGATRLVAGGAYRVRSDVPVTVYQLSPLEYQIDPPPADCPVATQCGGPDPSCKSFSNDASLLLPATALTGDYNALTWASSGLRAGFLAVTATVDGTHVKVAGKGSFAAGAGIDASGDGTVSLDAGDVLELVAEHDQPVDVFGADISGTRIRADKPVQVIAGHSCANVPHAGTGYCDHLEEGLFPVETLGDDYLVTFPAEVGDDSPHVVTVAAIDDATNIHFDPGISPDVTLGPDDAPVVIPNVTKDVHVTADKPILVAQLMQGSTSVPSMQGDPSLSLAIPSQQFRNDYTFIASTTYDTNFVNVIAKAGSSVELDGTAIPGSEYQAIGSSGYVVARHRLSGGDAHHIKSATAFGIVVYGYGKDTSYMYPGGLDLKSISPPPPK